MQIKCSFTSKRTDLFSCHSCVSGQTDRPGVHGVGCPYTYTKLIKKKKNLKKNTTRTVLTFGIVGRGCHLAQMQKSMWIMILTVCVKHRRLHFFIIIIMHFCYQ